MKRGTPDHPKVQHLCNLLNIEKAHAVGILELLWHFTAKFAPAGDIGKFPDYTIAKAVGWERPTGERGVKPECKLSDALVEAKWLDRCPCHRLVVHDWATHADQQVTRTLTRHCLAFAHPITSSALPVPVPEPEPKPEPPAAPILVNAQGSSSVGKTPRVVDLNGQTSQRFEEWWICWSKVRGSHNKTAACQAYISVVTVQRETACFECTASYLASLKDPSNGFNPDNFLFRQSRDDFTSRWIPRPKTRSEVLDELEAGSG